MANLTPAPPVAADAKNRAARTFVQGLLVALVIDVSRVAYEILSSSDGPVQWSVLGYALLRTALLALVAFGMRLQLPPPDDLTPPGVPGPIRPVHYRRPNLGRSLLELVTCPLYAVAALAIYAWRWLRELPLHDVDGWPPLEGPSWVNNIGEIHVSDAVPRDQVLVMNPNALRDALEAPVAFDSGSFLPPAPSGALGLGLIHGLPVTGYRADQFPITGNA